MKAFELQIVLTDPEGEVLITATVQVTCIGNRAVTQIACSREPSPAEQLAIQDALERAVESETGRPAYSAGAERVTPAEAQVSVRRLLGGGLG